LGSGHPVAHILEAIEFKEESRIPRQRAILARTLRRHSVTLFWEREFQMPKLRTLAAASLLFFGLSSAASAAPIAVTYGFSGGTASWVPAAAGTGGFGNLAAGMTVVYTSGSSVVGGTLGSNGQMSILALSFVTPGTLLGGSVPGFGAGVGLAGVRTPGGAGSFVGATSIPVSFFGTSLPPLSITGNAVINWASIAPGVISLNGNGVQVFPALALPVDWTITGIVGSEISRTVVPEPGTGVLLLGSLAGLAFGVRRIRR